MNPRHEGLALAISLAAAMCLEGTTLLPAAQADVPIS